MIDTPNDLMEQVTRALAEDVGGGDITASLVPADRIARATVVTRESAVLCGRPWFDATFRHLSREVRIDWQVDEGAKITPGALLCRLSGPARAIPGNKMSFGGIRNPKSRADLLAWLGTLNRTPAPFPAPQPIQEAAAAGGGTTASR